MNVRDQNPDDDKYDPFAERPEGPRTSDFTAFAHLVKYSVGTGILFLPQAFRRVGFVTAIICGILIGLIFTYTSAMLVVCAQTLCRRNRIPMLDFAKTAEISFLNGPEKIRKYAKGFGIMTNIIVCFIHFQAAIIYILYAATSIQQVVEYNSSHNSDVRLFILKLLPAIILFGLTSNLRLLAIFSLIGSTFMIFGILVTIYYLVVDVSGFDRMVAFTDILSVPMYCVIFLFALHNVTIVLPLENTMKNPGHLPYILICSTLLNTGLYIVFGLVGYNKYPNACDTIIKNLPLDEILAQSVKVAISLSVLFTLGLAYYVPIKILYPIIASAYGEKNIWKFLLRVASIIITTIIAIALPNMIPLLGLFTAFGMTTGMLLIPAIVEVTIKWEEATRALYVKIIAIIILWFLILIFGTIGSVQSMIEEYGQEREEEC